MSELDVSWDPAKALSNLAKHGVSFAQAATVLLDPLALTVFDTAHSEDEERCSPSPIPGASPVPPVRRSE